MAGIDSKTGGFKEPSFPQRAKAKNGQAIKTVSKPPQTNPAQQAVKVVEKEAVQQELHHENLQNKQDVKKQNQQQQNSRAAQDSFSSREKTAQARTTTTLSGQIASKEEKKTRRKKALNFAQKVEGSKLGKGKQVKAKQTAATSQKQETKKANNQQVVSNVSQVQPKEQKSKEERILDEKLKRIFTQGGDKGKGFVAFVQREMKKGPLSDSIKDLVEGFIKTLKGDSLSASEMIDAGEESMITLRGMVSADNLEEQILIQDSLANSVANSAGERADLAVVRNLEQTETLSEPPVPTHEPKAKPIDNAISYIKSISLVSKKAPWDSVKYDRKVAAVR